MVKIAFWQKTENGHKIHKNRFSNSNFGFFVTCISYAIKSSSKMGKFSKFSKVGKIENSHFFTKILKIFKLLFVLFCSSIDYLSDSYLTFNVRKNLSLQEKKVFLTVQKRRFGKQQFSDDLKCDYNLLHINFKC